jgi:hypothetical protein
MLLEIINPAQTISALYSRMYATTDPVLYKSLEAYLADLPAVGGTEKVLLVPQVSQYQTHEEYQEAYQDDANEDLRAEEESEYYYG